MDNYKLKIDIRHLSVISAIILLVNGISRFVEIPSRGIRITVLNIQWVISLNGNLLFMLLLALLVVVVLAAVDLLATRSHYLKQYRKLRADRRAMILRQAVRLREELEEGEGLG